MTLLDWLYRNAMQWPDRAALIHVGPEGQEVWRCSWRQVAGSVAHFARALRARTEPGQAVLLICDHDPRFALAFLACHAAGLVSVPLPPIDPSRDASQWDCLREIQADCGAALVISSGQALQALEAGPDHALRVPVLAVPDLGEVAEFAPPSTAAPDRLACLLYTSGSTSAPKAVAIHTNHLAFNAQSCAQAWSVQEDAVLISWMPNQHSFGLVYNLLIPLFSGCALVASAPASFLARPRLWFELFDRFRGTHGAAAAFGYQYCIDRLAPEELAGLDLSSWRVGLISAEPVRRATCEGFLSRFAALGLHDPLFCPLYGLSETGPVTSMPIASRTIFHELPDLPEGLALACVGRPLPGCQVAIVDPSTGARTPDGEPGEVWLQSPALMAGYYRRDAANLQAFATLADEAGRWLRTGDQGFLGEQGLFLTGRIKEILIVRGKNYYPQDIEWSALKAIPEELRGSAAAFESNQGAMIVVLELKGEDHARWADQAASSIARTHGISPDLLLIAKPGTIPKTASGKLRRGPCRERWEAGALDVLYQRCGSMGRSGCPAKTSCFFELFASVLNVPRAELDPDDLLSAYDLDSLLVTQLTAAVATQLGKQLHPTLFYKCETLAELATALECADEAP